MVAQLAAGGFTLAPIVSAIGTLYKIAGDINDFMNRHIEEMKASGNVTISRTGRILEMAKYGFGMGYMSSTIVIATGQFLLGNTWAAISTLGSAATLSNPVAMTCAAVGAIYYGWGALSETERSEMLAKLSAGLEIGIELIKSIVSFVTEKTKELLSSENFKELKKFVGDAAATFGRSLSDVTRKLKDMASDALSTVKKQSGIAIEKATNTASAAYGAAKGTASRAAEGARDVTEKLRLKK